MAGLIIKKAYVLLILIFMFVVLLVIAWFYPKLMVKIWEKNQKLGRTFFVLFLPKMVVSNMFPSIDQDDLISYSRVVSIGGLLLGVIILLLEIGENLGM